MSVIKPAAPSKEGENSHNTHDYFPQCTSVKSVGVSFDINTRFRRTMEDEHVVCDNFGDVQSRGYFAVYDGHGGRGAVDFAAINVHKNLLTELNNSSPPEAALKAAYLTTDKQIGEGKVGAGTTAVSALLDINRDTNERCLYIANVGDARAVLGRKEGAVRLSHDHKGSDPAENKRITDAGGFVLLNRVNGVLAVTRSLGDTAMKDVVTGEPFQTKTILLPDDKLLILACDGLWDVTSDQEAIDLIKDETNAKQMSDKLLSHALKRGSTDNISVMVIIL